MADGMNTLADARVRNRSRHGIAVHVTPTDLNLQSRIDRVTKFIMAQGWYSDVEAAGIRADGLATIEVQDDGRVYRRFSVRKWLREWSRLTRALDFLIWYFEIVRFYVGRPIACVNAHTLSVLPLCWFLARIKGAALIYEPHELETETMTVRGAAKPVLKFVERLFIGAADAVILVNGAIADWYRRTYRLEHVYVVRNLPAEGLRDPLPRGYYAERFGFAASDMVFLYQGLIGPGRGIDLLLAAAGRIPPNRHIVFLGFGSGAEAVKDAARNWPNVHYHTSVPADALLRYTAAAEVTLMMIEDVSLSYRLCYPNKYCESLTAGVPIICSNFLWFCSEVEHYACGWACSWDAEALARLISGIDRDAISAKQAGAEAWTRDNNWANEEKILQTIYASLQPEDRAVNWRWERKS
jgi:glycosyltransferase involved in cell wall biosynthesis